MNVNSLPRMTMSRRLRTWTLIGSLALGLTNGLFAQSQPANRLPAAAPGQPAPEFVPTFTPKAEEPPILPPVALPANIDEKLPAASDIAPAAIPEKVVAPAPLNLDGCVQLGLSRQPAIRAAHASLSAAQAAKNGLDNILFGRLLSRDLDIRRQQAALGVNIASANVVQTEWETRYAVTRMYYSVQYAKMQKKEVDSIVSKLQTARKRAKELVDAGDVKIPVTQIDVDVIALNVKFVQTKQAEAGVGILKAMSGLREAIGLGCNDPIEVADEPLPALVSAFDKDKLIAMALANRPEMQQARDANGLTCLEVNAQGKICFRLVVPTFASGADIHAKQIPQGVANGEFRPGAIGMEMPVNMAGPRRDRVDRANALNERAAAVVEKTHNLISLEVEATYLKWMESHQKAVALAETDKEAGKIFNTINDRFNNGKGTGEELLRARTLEDQARIQYNEALYNHMLALAALERVTAGGYRIGK